MAYCIILLQTVGQTIGKKYHIERLGTEQRNSPELGGKKHFKPRVVKQGTRVEIMSFFPKKLGSIET